MEEEEEEEAEEEAEVEEDAPREGREGVGPAGNKRVRAFMETPGARPPKCKHKRPSSTCGISDQNETRWEISQDPFRSPFLPPRMLNSLLKKAGTRLGFTEVPSVCATLAPVGLQVPSLPPAANLVVDAETAGEHQLLSGKSCPTPLTFSCSSPSCSSPSCAAPSCAVSRAIITPPLRGPLKGIFTYPPPITHP